MKYPRVSSTYIPPSSIHYILSLLYTPSKPPQLPLPRAAPRSTVSQ